MKTIDKIIKENRLKGEEYWKEYDKNGNITHYKDNKGVEGHY